MEHSKEKTILLVEDDVSMSHALQEKLEREWYTVLTAKNGEEGLSVALEKHPDLILLDIVMPRMDGITMLGELRKDAWGKNVSVIILSNLIENEKINQALQQGSHEYLIKTDWKIEDVVKKVNEKLQDKQ
jgi:two-component system, sensor histidine kinase and response regulator